MNVQPKPPRPPLNGVDTPTLLNTINFVAGQPDLAKFQFRAANEWIEGTHSRSAMLGFFGAGAEQKHVKSYFADGDHPTVLCGGRSRADARRMAAARAGDLPDRRNRQYRSRARHQAHTRSSLSSRAISICAASSVSRTKSAMATSNVSIRFEIEGDAPPEKLQQILDQARARSAVFDVLTNGVPVSVGMKSGPVDPELSLRPGAQAEPFDPHDGAFSCSRPTSPSSAPDRQGLP